MSKKLVCHIKVVKGHPHDVFNKNWPRVLERAAEMHQQTHEWREICAQDQEFGFDLTNAPSLLKHTFEYFIEENQMHPVEACDLILEHTTPEHLEVLKTSLTDASDVMWGPYTTEQGDRLTIMVAGGTTWGEIPEGDGYDAFETFWELDLLETLGVE